MEEASKENKSSGYGKRPMWQWILLYLVVAVVLYGGYYFFFLAKGGNNTSNPYGANQSASPTTVPSTASQGTSSNEMKVNLVGENNSGESGTAVLKEENGKTTVTINLTGFQTGGPQPAHVHMGACPGVGDIKYPLKDIVNGQSVTVLSATLTEIRQALPLAINIHKSSKEIAVYTSCGELPSQ